MGSSMSDKYSFIEDDMNSSLNHNFSFLDGSKIDSRINTPKEFNKDDNTRKSKSETDFDRFGDPKDVANTVLFLCSNLSDYITGETIHVNGGMYFS